MLNPIAALRQLVLPRLAFAPAAPAQPPVGPAPGRLAVGQGPPQPRVQVRPEDRPEEARTNEFEALLRRREPDGGAPPALAAPFAPAGGVTPASVAPGAPAPSPSSSTAAPSPAALQELWPALVRRVAWEGDGRRACVRLELGAGSLSGATVLLTYDEGRVRVALDHPAHGDLDAWRARIGARLVAAGLPVSEVE